MQLVYLREQALSPSMLNTVHQAAAILIKQSLFVAQRGFERRVCIFVLSRLKVNHKFSDFSLGLRWREGGGGGDGSSRSSITRQLSVYIAIIFMASS